MANSVGQIGLDLVVNQDGFNKQMKGIGNLAKKAGATLAAAFAVKKLVDFSKQCIELGSDLAEVQNVVDVTFTTMSSKVNEFAKDAAMSFGLSETMAKRYTGTFGAMSKAFGFSEKAAYDMSTTLTGLSGDVASFYNITQDEAYTKLKSVFTGETESLKDLGVVMTQAALDQYALTNGFGKTTAKMTEAEKVALRYAFVQQQLSTASGDFARTSDSWANQVRILNLQFESFKATIGQGLINVFTPVIKVINILLGKLATVANAFKSFTELITGNKSSSGGGVADTASNMESAAGAASDLTKNTTKAGKAAKEAAKQLGGIDKLNNLSSAGDSSGAGGDSGGASMGSAVDFGKLAEGDNVIDKTSSKFQGLIDKAKELGNIFNNGFKIGLGDANFSDITTSLNSIKKSVTGIFTDPKVATAASNWAGAVVLSLGKITGSVASIGITIGDNLTGGISGYFKQNSEKIKGFIVNALNIQSKTAEVVGDFSAAVADIFSIFRSDSAKQITTDIITAISNGFIGSSELALKLGSDLIALITKPITDNKDKIKEALQGTLDAIAPIFTTISDFIGSTLDKINQVYDEKIKPLIDSLTSGITDIVDTLLDAYNTYILPVIDEFAQKFKSVFEEHIQPAIDSVIEVFGDFADLVKDLWETILQPFIKWVIEQIVPVFAEQFKKAGDVIFLAIGGISDLIKGISEVFKGIIKIIKGIVNGDWKTVWEGCNTVISGIWKSIVAVFSTAWGLIKGVFTPAGEFFGGIWTNIKSAFGNIAEWFRDNFSTAWEAVKKVFSSGGKVFDGIKDGILNGLKAVINALIGGINKVVSIPFKGINTALNKIKGISILGAKPFEGLISEISIPQIPKLAQGGYVKANTPQLAMIGDNRHQGEVVAPEDKLRELLDKAVNTNKGTDISIIVDLMRQTLSLLTAILGKEYLAKITSGDVANALLYENEKSKSKTGKPLLT